MFSRESALALRRVKGLVDEVARTLWRPYAEPQFVRTRRYDFFDRYGIHVRDGHNRNLLWFGIWHPCWVETGRPLCIGISGKAPGHLVERFRSEFGEERVIGDLLYYGLSQDQILSEGSRDRLVRLIKETVESFHETALVD